MDAIRLQNVLKNVETIELIRCDIIENILKYFADYCPKSKNLSTL